MIALLEHTPKKAVLLLVQAKFVNKKERVLYKKSLRSIRTNVSLKRGYILGTILTISSSLSLIFAVLPLT